MGRADLVRRAMSKKKMDVMEEERRNFIYGQMNEKGEVVLTGAIRNGVDEKSASKIYDLMIDFANYAFNKSHSTAYAVVAYRTAWLKYNYPVEFMAALISSVMGNTNQVSLYIQECKRLGIDMLAPDINESYNKFTVSEGKIRFGLSAVKNVGENFIKATVKAREEGKFSNFTDFIERVEKVDSSVMNKRAVESLIKCGAMDSLGANRAQLLSIFEKTIDSIHADRKRNIEGQFSIFDTIDDISIDDNLPDLKEFPQNILLTMEKEILGIYISGHPLEPYKIEIERVSTTTTFDLLNSGEELDGPKDGTRVVLGGIIVEKKNKITKNNNMMAFITVEDLYGAIECIVFPATFERYNKFLLEDKVVIIEGKVSISEVEDPKIIVERISELNTYNRGKLYLKISSNKDLNTFERLKNILRKYNGETPVYVYMENKNTTVMADRTLWININSKNVIAELKELLGEDCVKIS